MGLRKICVLGGTGFVGRHLVSELTQRGYATRVLTRRRERHRELLVLPTLELVEADLRDDETLTAASKGCDALVNLVGILNENRPGDFARVHAELPGKVAEACATNHISRLIHMSALNASASAPSHYLQTKAEGESAVMQAAGADLRVTSFRPSVIFGPDDSFFNRFASLLRLSPFVFPLACPESRFAPVYVQDVVGAFADSLTSKSTWGESYDLCGPNSYTLKELVEYTAEVAGLKRKIIPLSDRLSRLQARALERLPGPPFSTDNYLSLQVDSICESNGLAALGIEATALETVVPEYLRPPSRARRYSRYRSAARRG